MDMHEVVGRNVARARKRGGVTQTLLGEGLASMMGRKWSKQTVSQLEHGDRQLNSEELVQIAAVLQVPACELLLPLSDTDEIEIFGYEGAEPTKGALVARMVHGGSLADLDTGAVVAELSEVARGAEKLATDARRAAQILGGTKRPARTKKKQEAPAPTLPTFATLKSTPGDVHEPSAEERETGGRVRRVTRSGRPRKPPAKKRRV